MASVDLDFALSLAGCVTCALQMNAGGADAAMGGSPSPEAPTSSTSVRMFFACVCPLETVVVLAAVVFFLK